MTRGSLESGRRRTLAGFSSVTASSRWPWPAPSPEELEELTERLRRRILRRMKGAVPEAAILDMLAWPHSGFSLNASVRIEAHDREAFPWSG